MKIKEAIGKFGKKNLVYILMGVAGIGAELCVYAAHLAGVHKGVDAGVEASFDWMRDTAQKLDNGATEEELANNPIEVTVKV